MSDSDSAPSDPLHDIAEIPPLGGVFGRLVKGLDRLFALLASLALLGIAAVVILQIVARVALPFAPAWTEELSRYLFIYLVALSSGLVLRRNRHVNVELFQHLLSRRGQLMYRALCCLAVGLFAAGMVPYAMQYAQIGAFQTSPTLKIPMNYIFFSTVTLFGLSALYAAIGLTEACVALTRDATHHSRETS
ncbi:TRAP-type C4-dicarboxylate transport system permease small subunit [Chromohalobacter marismortui]|uniref:TRAP transporter small permease protein n=1 Tax=Chromohalobacter marismortui TaxID=42055 RepID=A0A4R7NHU7_9GAMM|nr:MULTISPECIES: TRAP transporter small permease [Chromohalobacter]MCI0510882.1 TRAP transporter small permease [Chromohalobacter sp.]MCI0592138.1 TRAP transporter small permease [Chromohalobacter sp.]TDU20185.1 TRAP-type C4-dicarboxylate transport system permease small subunit [Chromohalobacter marismortui]